MCSRNAGNRPVLLLDTPGIIALSCLPVLFPDFQKFLSSSEVDNYQYLKKEMNTNEDQGMNKHFHVSIIPIFVLILILSL